MKLLLEFVKQSQAGKVFIVEKYYGGDADTEHFDEIELKEFIVDIDVEAGRCEITIDDSWKEFYSKLKQALRDYEDYDDVLSTYDEEIADAWGNAPNDPQNDYQSKTRLDTVYVVYYSSNGDKYQTYLL